MDKTNQFALMIEALAELAQEEQILIESEPLQTPPEPELPTLKSVLTDIAPLPQEALFLGIAEDGLPVLLNLYDPVPGPILIAGDQGSGKTKFLKTIARAADMLHAPSQVQYGIITSRLDQWKTIHGSRNNAGVYETSDDNAKELLQSLVTWAHHNKGQEQSILLLIDDLDAVLKLGQQAQQNLRWLLLRGTSRRVWTFVAMDAAQAHDLKGWLEFFHTRLFGNVQHSATANLLTGNYNLHHLKAGMQFAMREDGKLLGFWLPTIE